MTLWDIDKRDMVKGSCHVQRGMFVIKVREGGAFVAVVFRKGNKCPGDCRASPKHNVQTRMVSRLAPILKKSKDEVSMSGLISEIFEKSKSSCANTEGSRLWKLRGQNKNDFRQLKLPTNFCIAETLPICSVIS